MDPSCGCSLVLTWRMELSENAAPSFDDQIEWWAARSSMLYNQVISNKNEEANHLLLKYGIINFSNNRKNFLRINVEMTPDFLIKSEEIIFSDGLEQAKRTLVSDQNDIHKDHKDWLKKMYQKHYGHKINEK